MNTYWKTPPCKGCENRHPACHDKCADYIDWKTEMRAEKAKAKEEKSYRTSDPWTRGSVLARKKKSNEQ